LRKVVLVGAMVAMVVFATVPALALDGIDIGDSDGFIVGNGILFGGNDGDFFDFDRNHDGVRFFEEPSVVPSGAAAPASQEFSERRITSGPAAPKAAVSNTGDNVDLCPVVQQTAQTGNVANEQGVIQDASTADDLDFTGSSLTVGTENAPATVTATCDQTINQSAAA
jgi:hypothetical protein